MLSGDIDAELHAIVADMDGVDAVTGAMRYALSSGGKRLRPLLCLAAMDAVGGAPGGRARVRAACSLELIHTYSLVHDDLPCMDDDDRRRGKPTAHRVFGSRAAVLAGCALVPAACRLLLDSARDMGVSAEQAARAVRELADGAGAAGMVGGQQLDLESEGRALATPQLRTIHNMKTGALFRAALRVGAVLAGAGEQDTDALGRYGEHLGLAFQITDDVLDDTTDSAVLGKTAGKDRDADKATFVSHLGVPAARQAAAAQVDAALAALASADLQSPLLEDLARFAARRDR
jgi:geranylgeranyl pyrophosphate synthase